jgi:hypothetical protein
MIPKSLCFLKIHFSYFRSSNIILCVYYWYFLSSSKYKGLKFKTVSDVRDSFKITSLSPTSRHD